MTKKPMTLLANLPSIFSVNGAGPKPPKLAQTSGFTPQRRTEAKRPQTFVNRRRGK